MRLPGLELIYNLILLCSNYILTRSQNDELLSHITKAERMQMLDVENLSLNRVKSK